VFLFLQALCIFFLVKYNKTYEAAYSDKAHSVTGAINARYNILQYYFDLKEANKILAAENAKLSTKLSKLARAADSTNKNILHTAVDTLSADSTGNNVLKYQYYEAKVVNNSVSGDNNYITVEKGSNQGIEKGMAVTGSLGIVGTVVAVSPNYSIVMSLLNHNSRITAMLKRTGYNTCYVEWDGKEANVLNLINVPKNVDVKNGDSVVTSNLSSDLAFPEQLMIGKIISVKTNSSTQDYNIRIATSTDFYMLQFVYIIKNNFITEQKNLEASIPK
jgi:rod shape-determining protein MreC